MKLNLKNKSILIIEDFSVMRSAIKEMLYSLNAMDIVECSNAIEALILLKKNQFDIVLCDYNLGPGKNGQHILEEIRFYKLLRFDAVFIMVTVEHDLSMVLSAMENKPDEYLTKPFTAQQLLLRLQRNAARKEFLASVEREIARENFPQAIQNCDKMLKYNTKNMHLQLLKLRAELAIKVNDFSTAKAIYEKILQQRELLWAKQGLGKIYFYQEDYQRASGIFQELIEQQPMLMEAYDWLAKTLDKAGNHQGAIDILSTALDLSPHAILRQKSLASLAGRNGNLEIAEKAYQATIKLGRYSVHKASSDFSGLAKILHEKNAEMEALKIIDDMRQEFVSDPEAQLRAAVVETEIYDRLDDDNLVKQAYERVKNFSGQLGNQIPRGLQLDIIKTCYINADSDKADALLQDLIRGNLDDQQFIDEIKAMHRIHGTGSTAEQLIEATRQQLVEFNNNGVALFKEGKLNAALEVFSQAIRQLPNNQTIILNMAKILLHDIKTCGANTEKLRQARIYINKAVQIGAPYKKVDHLQREYARLATSHTAL